jgi:oxygen-dependent protoporphyrinogen oxidase
MPSIVVVGAGIAGLACAWRLRHAGHDVEVLECRDAPGGRLRTDEVDGYRLERGPSFLGPLDSYGRVLVRTLGLTRLLYPIQPADEGVLRRGRFEVLETSSLRAFARSPLLSARAKLGVARLGVELAARRNVLDLHHPEFAAGLERSDAAVDLETVAGLEARDFALGPLLEAWLGAPLAATSDAFVRLLLHALWVANEPPEALSGGMGTTTRALVADLSIRCGVQVHAVETESGGARVRYRVGQRERRAFADAVVVALPAPCVAALCPKLGPEERGYFESAESLRGIVVHALLDELPRAHPFHRVHLPRTLGFSIATIGLEHTRRGAAPPGTGLLRIVLTPDAAQRTWDQDDRRLGEQLVDELERTPLGIVRPRRFVVQRAEYAAPRFTPGALQRLQRFTERRTRSPRLAFAGGHAVGPYTEGALTSGLRAAAEIVHSLD